MKVNESKCIQKYKCLIQDCELSCCTGWKISVTEEDVKKWKEKAPQLMHLLATETDKDGKISYSMKREISLLTKSQTVNDENKENGDNNNVNVSGDEKNNVVNNNTNLESDSNSKDAQANSGSDDTNRDVNDVIKNNDEGDNNDTVNAKKNDNNVINDFIKILNKKGLVNSGSELQCVALKDGKCTIQLEHGEDMIPNLCSYFPHTYKKVGDNIFSSATMACPAVVDCILNAKKEDWEITEYDRKYAKSKITDYSDQANNDFELAKELHYKYLSILDDENLTADEVMFLLVKMSFNNREQKINDIINRFDRNLETARAELGEFDINYVSAGYQYKILETMEYVQKNRNSLPDLIMMFTQIKRCLGIDNSDQKLSTTSIVESIEKYEIIRHRWINEIEEIVDYQLRNVIKAELNRQLFPTLNYFDNQREMMVVLGFYYLFMRLVMMCEFKNASSAKSIRNMRRIISVIARTFYCCSTLKTYNFICDKKWDSEIEIEKAILQC